MPAGYILHGDGTGIDTATGLFWDRTNSRLGIGTNTPVYKLDVGQSSGTVNMRMASNTADDILLYFTGNITGNINMFQSALNASGNVQAQFINQNTSTGAAFLNIQVPDASSGDPYLQFTTSGGTNYSFGINNSDSDKFKFHSAASPSNAEVAAYTITSDNFIAIGTESPQANYKLTVADSVYVGGRVSAAGYTTRSDYNLKDEIKNINYGLNEIMQIMPVSYTYKSNGEHQLGFIAQDIGVIIPESVHFDEYMGVDYQSIIPILTKAIQQQQAQIEALKKRLLILENK
jgi:hypothetical protein